MADYNSAYTGPQIDAAVGLADTALQPIDTGWAQHADTFYTALAPFAILADTDTVVPNNNGSVIDSQKPADVTTFYDGTVITGRNGDGITITVDLMVIPTSVNTTYIEFWFDIGGSLGRIYPRIVSFPKGVGLERPLNFTVTGYTLNTWAANGATVYVRANGSANLHTIRYIITRTHKAR